MARSKAAVERDLEDCNKAIIMANPIDKEWDWLIRRRNELSIELAQAENPVHLQHCDIGWIYLPSRINNK